MALKNQGICIILNVGSGKDDEKSQPDNIRAAFATHGVEVELKIIKDGSQVKSMTRSAVAEGYQTIVAGGGDGTICAVASALADSKA
ncbi:MAG: diacylglycerol kinase, partial [Pseudorhodobacter sp.]|nr:diacylglycerol kinase [Pseudorhodobacter sp.]